MEAGQSKPCKNYSGKRPGRAHGNRVYSDHLETTLRMLAADWAEKKIVRIYYFAQSRTVTQESLSIVFTQCYTAIAVSPIPSGSFLRGKPSF